MIIYKKHFLRDCLAALSIGISGTASATTLTFDGGVQSFPLLSPATESGYTYQAWQPVPFAPIPGYWGGNPGTSIGGPITNVSVISNTTGYLSIRDSLGGIFNFQGLDYSAVAATASPSFTPGSQAVFVTGLLGNVVVGGASFSALGTNWFLAAQNWTTFGAGTLSGVSVDEIRIALDQTNQAFPQFTSQEFIDNVQLEAVVPEPATWAMMLAGFGLMGAALRRQTQAVRVRYV